MTEATDLKMVSLMYQSLGHCASKLFCQGGGGG